MESTRVSCSVHGLEKTHLWFQCGMYLSQGDDAWSIYSQTALQLPNTNQSEYRRNNPRHRTSDFDKLLIPLPTITCRYNPSSYRNNYRLPRTYHYLQYLYKSSGDHYTPRHNKPHLTTPRPNLCSGRPECPEPYLGWRNYQRARPCHRDDLNPFGPEFRKNSFNPAGKLQLFRSVKLIETHRIMKITKKFTLYKIEWIFLCYMYKFIMKVIGKLNWYNNLTLYLWGQV